MPSILRRAVQFALAYYHREPARVNSWVAAAVVAVAGLTGFVVSPQSVLAVIAIVAPIIGLGEVTRSKVSPTR